MGRRLTQGNGEGAVNHLRPDQLTRDVVDQNVCHVQANLKPDDRLGTAMTWSGSFGTKLDGFAA